MGSVGVASWLVGFASSPLCGGLVMIVPYPFFLTQWLKSSSRETVWKLRTGSISWLLEPAERCEMATFWALRDQRTRHSARTGVSRQSLEGVFSEVRRP